MFRFMPRCLNADSTTSVRRRRTDKTRTTWNGSLVRQLFGVVHAPNNNKKKERKKKKKRKRKRKKKEEEGGRRRRRRGRRRGRREEEEEEGRGRRRREEEERKPWPGNKSRRQERVTVDLIQFHTSYLSRKRKRGILSAMTSFTPSSHGLGRTVT